MSILTPPLKLPDIHVQRQALIYIRQSTLIQVRDHTGSTARQYHLVDRARELGWPTDRICVLDQDQGRSGASSSGREGCEQLVTAVSLGRAGAVFSLEAARLARSCSDWYRLLEICALTDTRVIDDDGIYDPGQYNDRLRLGFRGTLSEAELHWLRNRLLGGKLAKAAPGELRWRLPIGYVYDAARRIVLEPDEAVQQAGQRLFTRLEHSGSALAVVRQFADQRLRLPTRPWGRGADAAVHWQPLASARALAVLHNPTYAGVYVDGRTQTRPRTLPGEAPRLNGRTRQVKLPDWPMVRLEHHPAYLSWEQCLHNCQRLEDHRTVRAAAHRGAARDGGALLQGIVLCGRCGRRMTVRYLQGHIPSYECNQQHKQWGEKTCQSLRGDSVERAVATALLEAMTPAQRDIALATCEAVEAQVRQLDQQWQRQLERARSEAELARRRYLAVDPDHRLVARRLEQDWNARLTEVDQLEHEYARRPAAHSSPLRAPEREKILALAQDVPALWQAPTTTQTQRKQLLRVLLKEVTLRPQDQLIQLAIRWQTNACTTLEVARPPRSCEVRRTVPAVIERIRALAPTHTDAQIATPLHAEGLRPGASATCTATTIHWIRSTYGIASGCPQAPGACPSGQRGDGRYSAKAAAALLNVEVSTIVDWCHSGRLEAVQTAPHRPRWIILTPEIIDTLRRPCRQRKPRHPPG
jgi:DNA invertase Pin-like site-specific DNA recombinase